MTWPSGLLDALSHTLGGWLSNTLAEVTVLLDVIWCLRETKTIGKETQLKLSMGCGAKQVLECLRVLTPYKKNRVQRKQWALKFVRIQCLVLLLQQKVDCWSYLLVDENYHLQLSYKPSSLPVFLRSRIFFLSNKHWCPPRRNCSRRVTIEEAHVKFAWPSILDVHAPLPQHYLVSQNSST